MGSASRPVNAGHRLCSGRRPVCAHGSNIDQVRSAVQALEWAYDHIVLALGLPAPLPDAGIGGTDALDAYLQSGRQDPRVEADAPALSPFTVAPAFCLLPIAEQALTRRAATLCLGEAMALALDASEPPHLRRAFATSLWWTIGTPTSLDLEAIDDAQVTPESPIATRDRSPLSDGAGIFFSYLERTRSASEPGHLSAALFSAAASKASEADLFYRNEPDLFDVLSHSFGEDPARMAALMIDFSVTRAFLGDREDGAHLPELAWAGRLGRARFQWMIPFSSLPRRVAVQPPVESMGSALLWVDLDEVPIGSTLAVRAEWEAPVSFQWQLVRLTASGRELGRLDLPFQQRASSAEARLTGLEEAAAVLIVGTNVEGIHPDHPFDPDVSPFEPHSATVYLARL